MSLVAALLIEPNRVDEVADFVSKEDFYLPECRMVFEAIVHMRSKHKPIDDVTLADYLQAKGKLEEIGGVEFLAQCAEKLPHAAHAVTYAETIREKALRRATVSACIDGIIGAEDELREIDAVIGTVEGKLHDTLERQTGMLDTSIEGMLLDAINRIGAGTTFGVTSGFEDLDKLTNGFQPGSFNVLAARPSVGKTALAIRMLLHAARAKVPVTFFSLEQSEIEVAERILSMEAHVSLDEMRKNYQSEDMLDRLNMNASAASQYPVQIDATPGRTVQTIASVTRLLQRKHKTRLVVVDYLQFIEPFDRRVPREQQVSVISRGLKNLAKELKLAIICLAQLNRQIELRTDKTPQLSDLRESGSIEQDADLVMMIDRPRSYDPMADEHEATLYIRKHRNGKTGEVKLYWDGPTMEYRSASYLTPPGGQYDVTPERYR
jgi:replicative DNA helicase